MTAEDPGGGGSGERRARATRTRQSPDPNLQLLVDNIVDYAIFTLDVAGHILSWGPGAQRIKGYAADEIIGRHFSVFYPDADIASAKPDRELATASAVGRFEDEGWRLRKDGSRFWANVVITALRDERGHLAGFGKVTRDLTARKLTEDALRDVLQREREAARRLREADRAKSDLVAFVGHELRAPAGIIHGTADMLLEDWERLPEETRQAMVRQIVSTSDRLRTLVEDVLDVARIEAGRLRYDCGPVGLAAMVERMARDLDPGRDRLIVRCPDGEVIVHADEQRVWQVLVNLVGNALKFSPEGEPVEITCSGDADTGRVTVTDHGPGIEPDDQRRLFRRFSRVPGAGGAAHVKGTGLGLFIARSLVRAQGGRMWVESEPGRGATFAFTLPRVDRGA